VGEHSSWQWRPEYEQVWGGPDECLETIADVHADDGEMMESRGRLIAASPALLESLKETRDAAAELMRAIFNSGHSDAVISLLDPRYAGFGVRADRAIKLATELSHGLDV
jgi:hypothetical protein